MYPKQHLYFIRNTENGKIKIGVSGDVQRRLKGLQCAVGAELELLGVLQNAADLEEWLHNSFAAQRGIGEWFSPSPRLLEVATNPTRKNVELHARGPWNTPVRYTDDEEVLS